MNKQHHHKAIAKLSTETAWQYCIDPDRCAAHPERQRAHGNIRRIDQCACGTQRASEINAGVINRSAWDCPAR